MSDCVCEVVGAGVEEYMVLGMMNGRDVEGMKSNMCDFACYYLDMIEMRAGHMRRTHGKIVEFQSRLLLYLTTFPTCSASPIMPLIYAKLIQFSSILRFPLQLLQSCLQVRLSIRL